MITLRLRSIAPGRYPQLQKPPRPFQQCRVKLMYSNPKKVTFNHLFDVLRPPLSSDVGTILSYGAA